MLIGYARVSSDEQDLGVRLNSLLVSVVKRSIKIKPVVRARSVRD